jgi:cholest-4-en-3-one 26-monooxygenase
MFDAIADHLPNLAPLAEAERLRSGWLNGVKHWQVDYTGECPVASASTGM